MLTLIFALLATAAFVGLYTAERRERSLVQRIAELAPRTKPTTTGADLRVVTAECAVVPGDSITLIRETEDLVNVVIHDDIKRAPLVPFWRGPLIDLLEDGPSRRNYISGRKAPSAGGQRLATAWSNGTTALPPLTFICLGLLGDEDNEHDIEVALTEADRKRLLRWLS